MAFYKYLEIIFLRTTKRSDYQNTIFPCEIEGIFLQK